MAGSRKSLLSLHHTTTKVAFTPARPPKGARDDVLKYGQGCRPTLRLSTAAIDDMIKYIPSMQINTETIKFMG